MTKKHLNFGQGLDFLKFRQGNRGENEGNRRKTQENLRKKKENRKIEQTLVRNFEIETLISYVQKFLIEPF